MNELVKTNQLSNEQVELVKRTIAKGATDDELQLFLYTAGKTGLDPLTHQIHFVKRQNKKWNPATRTWDVTEQMTIQTGIDGYRVIAERSGSLAGIDDAVFDTEVEEHPGKASVTVWKIVNGIRVSFSASARWSEYVQTYTKDGVQQVGPMWKRMPYLMLAKCAEALALRKAFPNDLSGIYTNEEMSQADNEVKTAEATVTPSLSLEAQAPKDVQMAKDMEAAQTFVDQLEPQTKTCPKCAKKHMGKYDKCFECWKADKNGTALKTKTVINPDVAPF